MRRGGVELANGAHNLGELVHQLRLVLQAACRIDQHDVAVFLARNIHRLEGQRRRIRTLRLRDEARPGAVGPDFQLLDRGRAERIARGKRHVRALVGKLRGDLANCGRLARTVDADKQCDAWARSFGEIDNLLARLQDGGEFSGQRLADFSAADLAIEAAFRDRLGDPRSDLGAHVGRDQQVFEFIQRLAIQRCGATGRPALRQGGTTSV